MGEELGRKDQRRMERDAVGGEGKMDPVKQTFQLTNLQPAATSSRHLCLGRLELSASFPYKRKRYRKFQRCRVYMNYKTIGV